MICCKLKTKNRSLLHWPIFYLQDSKFEGNGVIFRGYGSLQVVVVSKEVLDEQLLMFSCRHPLTVMEEREEEPAPAQPRHHWAQQSSLLPPPGYVQVSPSNFKHLPVINIAFVLLGKEYKCNNNLIILILYHCKHLDVLKSPFEWEDKVALKCQEETEHLDDKNNETFVCCETITLDNYFYFFIS